MVNFVLNIRSELSEPDSEALTSVPDNQLARRIQSKSFRGSWVEAQVGGVRGESPYEPGGLVFFKTLLQIGSIYRWVLQISNTDIFYLQMGSSKL